MDFYTPLMGAVGNKTKVQASGAFIQVLQATGNLTIQTDQGATFQCSQGWIGTIKAFGSFQVTSDVANDVVVLNVGQKDEYAQLNSPPGGGGGNVTIIAPLPLPVQGANDIANALATGGRNIVTGAFAVEENWNGQPAPVGIMWQAPVAFPLAVAAGGGNFQWGEAGIADDYEDRSYGIVDVTLPAGATLEITGKTILSPAGQDVIVKQLDGTTVPASTITVSGIYYFNSAGMAAIEIVNDGTADAQVNYIGLSSQTTSFNFF